MTSEPASASPTSESDGREIDTVPLNADGLPLVRAIVDRDGVSDFPIVGMAASAGGLEAFTELLSHLPDDTGMAFVLIQHLAPDHHSLLSEILARVTPMPVCEAQHGMVVQPNQVYIIPPNTKMILWEGKLQLSPREKIFGKYMPGDAFFTSLAAARGHKAIAVVLSGGDGDGSLGLTAIKAAGGVTFAQCEGTAKFDSMPNTAVATGNVDFIFPPTRIAQELVTLSRNSVWTSSPPLIASTAIAPSYALATIFGLLRSTTGVDFSHYKSKTLDRRIQRRMLLCKLVQLEDYAAYLQIHPAEVKALYEEILIHVTSFFRDPEAFELLKTQVFPTIAQQKSAELPIRIWVAGCSTGEEVYSIAICLLEFLAERAIQPPIQIFATDISELSIDKARAGTYTEAQMVDVSPERRRRFFYPVEGGYHISKAVRELCVFARQDLSSDPPFSNVDLISCRNVLIYLGDSLQKRIMPIFHYSLNSTGFLLLGTSESTGKHPDLFATIDKKYRIYAKNPTATQATFSFTPSTYPTVKAIAAGRPKVNEQIGNLPSLPAAALRFDLQEKVDRLIAERYTPIGVVIDDEMQVLQLRGEIDRYLKLGAGAANLNLFNLVRSSLLVELRAAIDRSQRSNLPVTKTGLRLKKNDNSSSFNLQVIPFKISTDDRRFLILFEDVLITEVNNLQSNDLPISQGDLERENLRLRQELAATIQERNATQEYLRAVIQEQEYSNQDLKVANEEILSSNEELQSTNEELETAKEEIQATNEELNTTNDELRRRNLELDLVNNDLTNLLASINIPILMLTNDLLIRRFTPMAQQLFNFIPTDTGRPLSNIRTNLHLDDLEPLILEVLATLSVKELEVQTHSGYWYLLRIRPYRTTENKIDGVVMVLLDIDALKRSATTVEVARNYAEAIVETVRVPLLVLEADLRVNTANRSFCETFAVSQTETAQVTIFELGNGQWNIPGLRSILEEIITHNTVLENLEVEHLFEHIGRKIMLLNALKIIAAGDTPRILLSIEDITARKQLESERSQLLAQEQTARQEAETANRAKDDFLSNLSHELRNPLTAIIGWAQLLQTNELAEATVTRGLATIYRSAKVQSQLIEDMLDLSRIANGKLHLNLRRLDLVALINGAIESVQLAADAKSIQLVANLTPIAISGDVDRLGQVLWNLLTNAIKFTPNGGRVEIALATFQNQAQIRVSDTGQGMGTDLLLHVFDRFHQGDSSRSKSTQGLGLGLSIVQQIVELHSGTVRAESAGEGQGTTLVIQLPLADAPSDLALMTEPILTPAVYSLTGLNILAVDDEVDILDLMKFILENVGAEVTIVTSAQAAIAMLLASPGKYDALLSDIGMPEEDGYALIRQVRALAARSGGQIPAAAITAYVSNRDRQLALDAGFQVHLAKPIDPAQLIQMVANLTGRSNVDLN
ncbi:CheR family methyltransferase [Chamaesiphon minutus]|uniref:histidine kinase n=1 Tax=Chamaesiphon minutus (strain ATCC 27169 / PCC 6605) TaxID=1173020 RepID=K9UJT8_CHAP6|nr:chemotaxis protein CheB [Chamaesiphon minutus]AFY95347.1 PAS domain S-box [Chamaesiphon minutus PCC 6605]